MDTSKIHRTNSLMPPQLYQSIAPLLLTLCFFAVCTSCHNQEASPDNLTSLLQACKKQNKDSSACDNAINALERLHVSNKDDLLQLCNVVPDTSQAIKVRLAAISVLGDGNVSDESIVAALLTACKDQDWQIRQAAMVALLKFVGVNPKVIAALFTACKDDDWEIREAAITVLGHRNVADQDTLEALLDAYNDQKWDVRDRARQVLEKLYGVKSNNVTLLINKVNATTQNKDRCIAAIEVLGNLKEANSDVVLALLQACQHENQYVRNTALLALSHCNPTSDALEVLLQACKDDNEDIYKVAIEVWRTLQEVYPDILTCLCTIVLRWSASVEPEQNNQYVAVGHIVHKKESCIAAMNDLVALKANDEDTI